MYEKLKGGVYGKWILMANDIMNLYIVFDYTQHVHRMVWEAKMMLRMQGKLQRGHPKENILSKDEATQIYS